MNKIRTPRKQHQLMYKMEQNFFWFVSLRENEKYFIKKNFKGKAYKSVNILDAGCGAGYFVSELKKDGFNAKGFDFSQTAVDLSTKRDLIFNKDIFLMNIFELKFKKESFDCILLNDVLFAYNINEANKIINNLKALLRPNGLIIGQTAAFKFLYGQNDIVAGTKYRYTKKEISQILVNNNLIVEKISYRNFLLFIPFAIKRLLNKKKIDRSKAKSDLRPMSMIINNILIFIFRIENFLLRFTNYFIGGSVFWISKKK